MARAFDSTAKNLAIPQLALFEIGWIVFIAGYSSLCSKARYMISYLLHEYHHCAFSSWWLECCYHSFMYLASLFHAGCTGEVSSTIIYYKGSLLPYATLSLLSVWGSRLLLQLYFSTKKLLLL